jgi:hypothetical protein
VKTKVTLCDWCADEIREDSHVMAPKWIHTSGIPLKEDHWLDGMPIWDIYRQVQKECESLCVRVADYYDDFAIGDGNVEFYLCKDHLLEAVRALDGNTNDDSAGN